MAGSDHAIYLHAQPAQRFHMYCADEACPDDRGADFRDPPWSNSHSHPDSFIKRPSSAWDFGWCAGQAT
jgi:hypothetical protein